MLQLGLLTDFKMQKPVSQFFKSRSPISDNHRCNSATNRAYALQQPVVIRQCWDGGMKGE